MARHHNFIYCGSFDSINGMSKAKSLEIGLPFLTLPLIKENFKM